MPIEITKCSVGARDVLGAQEGNAVTIADDAVSAALPAGFYRILATAACRVRIGVSLSDATGGERFPADLPEVRAVPEGNVIAVDALA